MNSTLFIQLKEINSVKKVYKKNHEREREKIKQNPFKKSFKYCCKKYQNNVFAKFTKNS